MTKEKQRKEVNCGCICLVTAATLVSMQGRTFRSAAGTRTVAITEHMDVTPEGPKHSYHTK